jgi:tetratricopeptide (TPR) repeat protein
MNPAVSLLFREVADLTCSEREQLFTERQIAPALRAEIEALLSFDSTDHSLTEAVADAVEDVLKSDTAEFVHWGRYRQVRVLGTGGMGTVYLAERTDGEIQQQVAIKLLVAGKDRPAWRDRFLRERQLLASLNHPSIVHVIDAGHTGDDRPYLVMEYVQGVPIDVYAEHIQLREKLKLFLRVCEGVSHAHRHLIIHRDLKPSNILVDSSGRPKLLDFGIAKLLDETSEPTRSLERVLTPNYASPEQLRGVAQTTATDIYSLGAVLYKLLTGKSPHQSAPFEIVMGARQIPEPTRLNPSLPTDIDYILRKALRTEPEERYASVDALANDIQALLDWRPVEARSGDVWYRTRRFLRRYWLPVTAAAVAIIGLSVGLYIAERQRAVAQRRFLEVRQLANKLFDIDAAVRQSPGTMAARQLIVNTSLDYLRRLAVEARSDPDLALEAANAYMRVARVQGVPMQSNLGQTDLADKTEQTAEALVRSVLVTRPDNRVAFLRMAQILHDRMMLRGLRDADDDSLDLARQSAEWMNKYLNTGKVDLDPSETQGVLLVLEHIANQYRSKGQLDDALRLCQRILDLTSALGQPYHAGTVRQITTMIHRDRAELEEALRDSREAVRILEPASGNAGLSVGQIGNYAMALTREAEILGGDGVISMGRYAEAIAPLERAFQMVEQLAGQDPNDSNIRIPLSMAGNILAGALLHTDPARALAIYDQTLRRIGEIKNNPRFRRDEVQNLAGSTYALRALGRNAEARKRLDDAFSRLSDLKLYPAEQVELRSEAQTALIALAEYEAATGNVSRGVEIYRDLLARVLAAKPDPQSHLADAIALSDIYSGAAKLNRQAGQLGIASDLEARRVEIWQSWAVTLPNSEFVRRQMETVRVP